jgi:tetratricopeptide (TPR) repeat protein
VSIFVKGDRGRMNKKSKTISIATLIGSIILINSFGVFFNSQPAQATYQDIQQMAKKVCAVMGGRAKPDPQTIALITKVLEQDLADPDPVSQLLNRYVLAGCPKDYLAYQQRKRRNNPFAKNPLIVNTGGTLVNGNNDPKTAVDYRSQGRSFLTARNYPKAIAAYNKAIALDPSTANYYYERAGALYLVEKMEPALKDLEQAIQLNPNDANFYVGRGVILAKMGDKENAMTNYTQAISLDPNLGVAYYRRSIVRGELGDVGGAKEDLATATKLGFKVK